MTMEIDKMQNEKSEAMKRLMKNDDFKLTIIEFIKEAGAIALTEDIDSNNIRDELKARSILKRYIEDIII